MTDQPLSEKIDECVYDHPRMEGAIRVSDVKQAIQKTLKELKDKALLLKGGWQNSSINYYDFVKYIDTTFKQNFGGLAE